MLLSELLLYLYNINGTYCVQYKIYGWQKFSPCAVENEIVTVKICFANFVWILMSLRASLLKIPQWALPLDPTTFEKVDKTFNCHSYTMRKSFQPLRCEIFSESIVFIENSEKMKIFYKHIIKTLAILYKFM